MNLSLIFVFLVSSVVISSGTSCDVNDNVTVQDPKYFKFDGGFFFIHGLTNGESVVMYKPQVEQKVYIQHTFFNDDCVYETTKYIMNEDGKFVDHVKVQKNPDEFSIRKTLIFIVEGKVVEINFKINQNGYVLNEVEDIETFEPEMSNELGDVCEEGLDDDEVSTLEFDDANSTQLNYKNDGRFFYQYAFQSNHVIGKYAFKVMTSSDDFFYTFDYRINDGFADNSNIRVESYNIKNSDNFSVNIKSAFTGIYHMRPSFFDYCFQPSSVLINVHDWVHSSPGQWKPFATAAKAN